MLKSKKYYFLSYFNGSSFIFFIFEDTPANYSIWKVNKIEHYFKRISDTQWIETKDGTFYMWLLFIKQEDDYVVIQQSGGLFIKLNSVDARTSDNQYNFGNYFQLGKWII